MRSLLNGELTQLPALATVHCVIWNLAPIKGFTTATCSLHASLPPENFSEWPITCSWHQNNENTNSPITNFKCSKMPLKWKNKTDDVFKVMNKKYYRIKKGFKGSLVFLKPFKFVNWWIRGFVFLMLRTGYKSSIIMCVSLTSSHWHSLVKVSFYCLSL